MLLFVVVCCCLLLFVVVAAVVVGVVLVCFLFFFLLVLAGVGAATVLPLLSRKSNRRVLRSPTPRLGIRSSVVESVPIMHLALEPC